MALMDHPHVQDFLHRQRTRKAENTAATRESDVQQFSHWYDGDDPTEVTYRDIEQYLVELDEQGYAAPTIESRLHSLGQLYDHLVNKERVLDEDPTDPVSMKDLTRIDRDSMKQEYSDTGDEGLVYLSEDEKEALCENVPAPQIRNELIIRFLWQTGLREHEARKLKLGDVNREERIVDVRSDKSHRDRLVRYRPALDFLLDQWVETYRKSYTVAADSDHLFLTRKAPKMAEGSISEMIKKAAHEAGVQEPIGEDAAGKTRWRVTAHALRHSFGVQMVREGVPLPVLKKLMGHSEIKTTQTYADVASQDAVEEVEQYLD